MPDATEQAILTAREISLMISRMASQILETHRQVEGLALVGIQTRGVPLARRLAAQIEALEGKAVPLGVLDITLYRDDVDQVGFDPEVKQTDFPFDVQGSRIVLVDDVLYTGRTVRAALDEIMDFGRPATVHLAVLIDRGGRELPIAPTWVGKSVGARRDEIIEVRLVEVDGGEDVVRVRQRSGRRAAAASVSEAAGRKARAAERDGRRASASGLEVKA